MPVMLSDLTLVFQEYKRMLAYSKLNLLESKARRFFQLVDDQHKYARIVLFVQALLGLTCRMRFGRTSNRGYIDEREFVVALYIANYLRLHGEGSSGDKRPTAALSPSDVFHQLDGDHDEMLNVFEYERAIELLGVSRSTPKQAASVRTHFQVSSAFMTLAQFKRAWVDQIDVRSELSKRGISPNQVPQEAAASLSLHHVLTKGRRDMERLKQLLLDSIDEVERREVGLALKAKAEVVEMDKRRREEEQEAARALFKQHRHAATETRTNEAIRERQDKIRRRKERVIKDRQAKEERKLLQKMTHEAERRSQLEMQVARELVATKAEILTLQKAKSGADVVDLRSRKLKELPETLMRGRDALAALSSLLVLDLGKNELTSLPGSIFTHLFVLKSLDVSENLLETLPVEIGEANDLVTLNLRSNRLNLLPAESIRKLGKLKVLDLAFNRLTRFGDECDANGLPALEELDLSFNAPFDTLTESVGSLASLKRLALKGNTKLVRLPINIHHLQALAMLDCSSCGQLRRVGRDVFGRSLRSLRRVDLSFNALVSLPESIGQLRELQDLAVRENALVTLPSTFGDLSSLVMLNCEHNQLEKLPRAAFSERMTAMETLVLSRNKLHDLPETIGLVTNMRLLKVSNNRLTSVPMELGALVNLTMLDLSWNALDHLPEELGCLAALRHCDLSHNQLQHLPSSIVLWKKLRLLSCSDNRLTCPLTPSLCNLRELEYLDLSRNTLRALDACVYELENLEVLNVSSNKLTLLPREMGSGSNCRRLRKLDLYRNKLSALPLEFAERLLDQLEVLVIDGNPLTRLPEKWSAKWGPRDQFSTAFSGGYTPAEAKDWTRDCADWYPFIVETWRDLMLARQHEPKRSSDGAFGVEEAIPTCEDVDQLLPVVSGDDFVCSVRAKMGEDKWKERYQRLVLHYYYEFRHVGHTIAFHERSAEVEQQVERQEAAVEQRVHNLRDARAEEAIQENNAFRAKVNAAYHIEDAVELARKSVSKRHMHERRLIVSAQQESAALNEQIRAKLPIAKQREAERRRREHAAILLSIHEHTQERRESQSKRVAHGGARYKYGRVAAAGEADDATEESLRG